MPRTVLQYGKASQQRIGPYIVISIRKLPAEAKSQNGAERSFKSPQEVSRKTKNPFMQCMNGFLCLVPRRGLEPPRCYSLVPETSASTNSATWASQEVVII